MSRRPPLVLAILDGWGLRDDLRGNAIAQAELPNWHRMLERYPHTALEASGEAVGLPAGVMGNSEVGHINIGSGRVVPQGLVVIDAAITDGSFATNATLAACIDHVRGNGGTLHLFGLVSDGRVHSSLDHVEALIDACAAAHVPLAIDAFLDGRDTPPRSAQGAHRKSVRHAHRRRGVACRDVFGGAGERVRARRERRVRAPDDGW
jgi:2,3-bisphosphoglycerate-independent phosphoglycerate mutase